VQIAVLIAILIAGVALGAADPVQSYLMPSTTAKPMLSFDPLAESSTEVFPSPVEMIETVIFSLADEKSAMVSDSTAGRMWKFKYGSVDVLIQLTGNNESDVMTVWSVVLTLPVLDQVRLNQQLLEMNMGTLEARFGIMGNSVVVLASRTLADINPTEVARNITIVATIADENDEALADQYPTL
jgi:hypothetical protein